MQKAGKHRKKRKKMKGKRGKKTAITAGTTDQTPRDRGLKFVFSIGGLIKSEPKREEEKKLDSPLGG